MGDIRAGRSCTCPSKRAYLQMGNDAMATERASSGGSSTVANHRNDPGPPDDSEVIRAALATQDRLILRRSRKHWSIYPII